MIRMFFLIVSFIFLTIDNLEAAISYDGEWSGKIFPDLSDANSSVGNGQRNRHENVPMGVKNKTCDWGEDPKGIDGDLGPQSYTCFSDKSLYEPNPSVHPILKKDYVPKAFIAWHHCMNESIIYDKAIPTFGDHRPLWPKYGEYTFLPKQRWIHSLEHGSIVMLYHPCADKNEVDILRQILKECLYQYVITALNELSYERPLVLVAWGVSLEMSKVDKKTVVDFIRTYAHKAPEKVNQNGQYERNLVETASTHLKGKEEDICLNF